MAYINFKNAINEDKIRKQIIKASEWNELFNILATQANYLDTNMQILTEKVDALLDIGGTIPIGNLPPETESTYWFKILKIE